MKILDGDDKDMHSKYRMIPLSQGKKKEKETDIEEMNRENQKARRNPK